MPCEPFKTQVRSHQRCNSDYVGGGFYFWFGAFYFDRYRNRGRENFESPKFKSVITSVLTSLGFLLRDILGQNKGPARW